MKILITGGYGFLGFHLANSLSRLNCSITLLDIKPVKDFDNDFKSLLLRDNISYIQADLLDKKFHNCLKNDYSHVFHLAALLGVQNVLDNPLQVLSMNFEMLRNLIYFINSLPTKPILFFASTSEVYAGTLKSSQLEFPTPENSLLILPDLDHPRTSYMLSKIYGESLCYASKIKTIILRPHNLYGPRMGMKHVIPQLIKRIKNTPKGGSIGIYSPNHKRTFCFIDDAVEQIYQLINKVNLTSSTFNLGTQKPELKMQELGHLLLEVMNRDDILIKQLDNTPGSPERRCPSTVTLDNITGRKERTSMFLGLKRTYNWYLKNSSQYLVN